LAYYGFGGAREGYYVAVSVFGEVHWWRDWYACTLCHLRLPESMLRRPWAADLELALPCCPVCERFAHRAYHRFAERAGSGRR
jgi:hypothetical protein